VQAESKIGETLLAFLGTTESNKVFDLFCLQRADGEVTPKQSRRQAGNRLRRQARDRLGHGCSEGIGAVAVNPKICRITGFSGKSKPSVAQRARMSASELVLALS
jgi:hypothetical protein